MCRMHFSFAIKIENVMYIQKTLLGPAVSSGQQFLRMVVFEFISLIVNLKYLLDLNSSIIRDITIIAILQ